MNPQKNAQLVMAARGFAAMVFTVAASPVLHEAGASFQTISIGFGLLYSILALAEIPTGVWADLFGARKSAIAGGVIQTISLAFLCRASDSQTVTWIGFCLYGFGSSFVSGALSALLFGNAKIDGGSSFDSGRYFSLVEKASIASYILASVAVGFFSHWFGLGTFAVSGFFYLAAALYIAIAIPELPPEGEYHSTRVEFVNRIKEGFQAIGNSIRLKALLPIRILHQIETILGVLWLPWIQALGGGHAVWISILSTGSYLLRYFVTLFLSKRPKANSLIPRLALSLTLMALGALICAASDSVWTAVFGVWIMAGARGAFLPAVQTIMHDDFPDRVRTTGISAMNFSTESLFAISYFISAAAIDKTPVSTAWLISCVSFLIAAAIAGAVIRKRTS